MNKQELIRKYEELLKEHSPFYEPVPYTSMVELFLKELKQLDEPEKVKIPQFVAEYIEQKKDDDYHLLGAMIEIRSHKNKEIDEWFEEDDNMELFARAWLDGYEVEEEPKYTVRVKGVNEECEYLFFGELSNTWKFRSLGSFGELKKHHTRKELEDAGFGWVFDCEGIEIEEVK